MISLGFSKPSSKDQTLCLSRSRCGQYNYDAKYVGATMDAVDGDLDDAKLKKDGYRINHGRVKLGTGLDAYNKGKDLLKQWAHFQLGWAFVDRNTPIRVGEKLCVCIHEVILWFLNPLEILFVNDGNLSQSTNLEATKRKTNQMKASSRLQASHSKKRFYFVVGTLKGHLLAGEERFSVEWNEEDDAVWFEIFSFSKPATLLSMITYPYVIFKQKLFARQSMGAIVKAMQMQKL